jgi:hypothetical protein
MKAGCHGSPQTKIRRLLVPREQGVSEQTATVSLAIIGQFQYDTCASALGRQRHFRGTIG